LRKAIYLLFVILLAAILISGACEAPSPAPPSEPGLPPAPETAPPATPEPDLPTVTEPEPPPAPEPAPPATPEPDLPSAQEPEPPPEPEPKPTPPPELEQSPPAGSEITTFSYTGGEYQITQSVDGVDIVKMEGFSTSISPGNPMLPHKMYNILLPPDVVWSSIQVRLGSARTQLIDGIFNIEPAPPAVSWTDSGWMEEWGEGKNMVDGCNMNVYGNDAVYPASPAALHSYSQMRKWKSVMVDLISFQYNPVSGQLILIEEAVVEVSYDRSPENIDMLLMGDTVLDDAAPDLFLNYETGSALYESYTEPEFPDSNDNLPLAGAVLDDVGPADSLLRNRERDRYRVMPVADSKYDYVIITTNDIESGSNKLSSFVSQKRNQGYRVLVVTEDEFNRKNGQAPNHKAEKIRQWLKDNYVSMSIKYVLLIGDPHPYESGEGDIPMKMCYPRRGTSNEESPTDFFYADLTGDWDYDDDRYYGEYGKNQDYPVGGGVDFGPEVYVGRIPVYGSDYSALDDILQKIIDYDNESGNRNWRKNVLLPMCYEAEDYDGAMLAEQMKDDYMSSNYNVWRMYQQGTGECGLDSSYSSEQKLRGGTMVRDRWAGNDYGIVCWWGHGSKTSAAVGYDGCWDDNLFTKYNCSSLDDAHPSFVYQCSCLNGYPEETTNLQYSILKQGGVAAVAASRISWFSTAVDYGEFDGNPSNAGLGYEYVKKLIRGKSAGEALYSVKQSISPADHSAWLMNWFDFNLYGDPSLKYLE
jgi:hypothetical protein